ncbi:AraC family transcriptional regulator [Erysipelotrichaceae bacterium 66-17]
MFSKTSSIEFLKYGEVFSSSTSQEPHKDHNHIITIENEKLTYFFQADTDIFIRSSEGITALVVTKDLSTSQFDEFVVHRVVKINSGVLFNFISLSTTSKIELAFPADTTIRTIFYRGEYKHQKIYPIIRVKELIAYFYNVRGPHYFFPGESDSNWEFTFVDNGELLSTVEDQTYKISSNQMMIYAPNQFHDQKTLEKATSYLTVIVDLDIGEENKEIISNKVFDLDRDSRQVLDTFIRTDDSISPIEYNKMILTIEKIVVNLLSQQTKPAQKMANTPMQQKFEDELLNEIILYINENIYSPLYVEDLCERFAISRSSLQSLFRNYVYTAPKEYISNLKLEKSKVLIKESKYTISEIAYILGFSSIHYFSRRFKQKFGMSPTDYATKFVD